MTMTSFDDFYNTDEEESTLLISVKSAELIAKIKELYPEQFEESDASDYNSTCIDGGIADNFSSYNEAYLHLFIGHDIFMIELHHEGGYGGPKPNTTESLLDAVTFWIKHFFASKGHATINYSNVDYYIKAAEYVELLIYGNSEDGEDDCKGTFYKGKFKYSETPGCTDPSHMNGFAYGEIFINDVFASDLSGTSVQMDGKYNDHVKFELPDGFSMTHEQDANGDQTFKIMSTPDETKLNATEGNTIFSCTVTDTKIDPEDISSYNKGDMFEFVAEQLDMLKTFRVSGKPSMLFGIRKFPVSIFGKDLSEIAAWFLVESGPLEITAIIATAGPFETPAQVGKDANDDVAICEELEYMFENLLITAKSIRLNNRALPLSTVSATEVMNNLCKSREKSGDTGSSQDYLETPSSASSIDGNITSKPGESNNNESTCQNLDTPPISKASKFASSLARRISEPVSSFTIQGKSFVYSDCETGVDIESYVLSHGGIIHESSVQSTDFIIIGNAINSVSPSATVALELSIDGENIQALTEEEFWSLTVTISDSVTSIGDNTFSGCESNTSFNIPAGETSIGDHAYSGCERLTSITIPYSVTSIGDHAFSDCINLIAINIPNSVTSIGNSAFSGCIGLPAITIPDSVTYMGFGVFINCKNLTAITIPDSVTYMGFGVFINCENLTAITIPNSVTSIGQSAFSGCKSLTAITIPSSVTSIDNNAFFGCKNLTDITIPDSVTSIGDGALSNCGLERISVSKKNREFIVFDHVLYNIDQTKLVKCPINIQTIIIPNSVKSIGDSAFSCCESLTSVTIPNSVTNIGEFAFHACKSLIAITIPYSMTSIGDNTFSGCGGLTVINIPNSVTSIGASAFYDCECLTAITIPYSVTSIGDNAFDCCKNLTAVIIPNSVTSIGDSAFFDCECLTAIIIPNSMTSIGDNTFSGCKSLATITIPNNVNSIGDYAFRGCLRLSSITIHDGVTSIGDYAFSGCSNLTAITIPNSVTCIGTGGFEGCECLTTITILNSETDIGFFAFHDCSSLKTIIVPNRVIYEIDITQMGFENSTGLTIIDSMYSLLD